MGWWRAAARRPRPPLPLDRPSGPLEVRTCSHCEHCCRYTMPPPSHPSSGLGLFPAWLPLRVQGLTCVCLAGSLARVFGSSERLLYEQQQRQTEILLAAERLHAAGGILALPRRRRRWLGFLRWPFGKWRAAGSSSHGNSHEKLGSSPGLSPPRMRRSGSELFDRPSGDDALLGGPGVRAAQW